MNEEKDFGTHKTTLIAIIYNMKLISFYGQPNTYCKATIFQSCFKMKKYPKTPIQLVTSNRTIIFAFHPLRNIFFIKLLIAHTEASEPN